MPRLHDHLGRSPTPTCYQQKTLLLSRLDLIQTDTQFISDRIENPTVNARALGEVADKVIDWATQLSEALYEIEVEEEDIPNGN